MHQHSIDNLPARYIRALEDAHTATRSPDRYASDERVSGTVDPRRLPAPAGALQILVELTVLGDSAGSGQLHPLIEHYIPTDLIEAYAALLLTRERGTDHRTAISRRHPALSPAKVRDLTRSVWMRPQGGLSDRVLDIVLLGIESALEALHEAADDERGEYPQPSPAKVRELIRSVMLRPQGGRSDRVLEIVLQDPEWALEALHEAADDERGE